MIRISTKPHPSSPRVESKTRINARPRTTTSRNDLTLTIFGNPAMAITNILRGKVSFEPAGVDL